MKDTTRTSRYACLTASAVLLAVAVAAPGAALAGNYPFSARMAQHLLLQLVIPPLFFLGLPGRVNHLKFTAHPVVAWLIGLCAMWAWHEPALCNAAVRSPALHALQTLSLLAAGAVFWWPVFGARRLPPSWGIVYLFTACLGCTVLGILITFAQPGLYIGSILPGALNDWQFAAPDDQRVGGLLMWVPGCLVYISAILALLARWYGEPELPLQATPTERTS